MPINLQTETVLSLTEATHALPLIDGKRPHTATIWRWIRRGLRGVHLDHCRIGHRVVTSAEALNRFAAALAERDTLPSSNVHQWCKNPPRQRTDAHRDRDIERAEANLHDKGIL